jgi:hypothetical protein
MWKFKAGDLVAQKVPSIDKPLKIGIVIDDCDQSMMIKWISFNKDFFMEKEGDIFEELNKTFILDTIRIHRTNMGANLLLLNPS